MEASIQPISPPRVRVDLESSAQSKFMIYNRQSRSNKCLDEANHTALSHALTCFPPTQRPVSFSQDSSWQFKCFLNDYQQFGFPSKSNLPSLFRRQSNLMQNEFDSNIVSSAKFDFRSTEPPKNAAVLMSNSRAFPSICGHLLYPLIVFVAALFVKCKNFKQSICQFTFPALVTRIKFKSFCHLDGRVSNSMSTSCLSTLFVWMFLIIFTVFIDATPLFERKLSNRIVNTKYGALRGHVVSLQHHRLQDVEVFLGKLCTFIW